MSTSVKAKEKVVSCKGQEAEEMVLSYMRSQNRPYGAIDLSANLKSRISKPQAQKTLNALVEKNEIVGKAYGKTIIYCYPQKDHDTISPEELTLLQSDVVNLKAEELKLKEDVRGLSLQLNALVKDAVTVELPAILAALIDTSSELTRSLANLSSADSVPVMTVEEIAAMSERLKVTSKVENARRKIVKEVEGILMERADAKKGMEARVWSEAGWEDEEEI